MNGPVVVGWAAANASPDTVRALAGAVVHGLSGFGESVPSGFVGYNSLILLIDA